MMRYMMLLAVVVVFGGCSTKMVNFEVTSEPSNAPVEVNGYSMGKTPTTISLECKKSWVGLANSPDGWSRSGAYEVTAFPPPGAGGDSQTKVIDPCSWKGEEKPAIFFDLRLKGVNPVDRIQVDINDTTTQATSPGEREKLLQALKELRDAGAITQEEYAEKVLKLLDEQPQSRSEAE